MFIFLIRSFISERLWCIISMRYEHYRVYGSTRFASLLACCLFMFAWIFLNLESKSWQKVRSDYDRWFPHISADQPKPADFFRYVVQIIWILLFYHSKSYQNLLVRIINRVIQFSKFISSHCSQFIKKISQKHIVTSMSLGVQVHRYFHELHVLGKRVILFLMGTSIAVFTVICISQPFGLLSQFIFVFLLWAIVMVVRRLPGRLPRMILIVLSLIVSCRYIWWRYTATLNWDDMVSFICGILLLFAETYAWIVLILGYFQTIWPLNRNPVPLPEDVDLWPTVDLLVPTYNEGLNVVKPTIYAALGIDWPKGKLKIHILDDGTRAEFREFAQTVGVNYITRKTHEHAKAGNINNALKELTGDYVAIFDCDHVPTRSFLQLTMGWFFKDPKLALIQTPHHFFSPDPFERNLGRFRKVPNEGTLFYGLIQDGNDMWDATFFCGSCAILSRKALDEIGGIATQTVTEDAHTSLRLHRKGYTSAYIRIPLAAGLATESLSAHIGQRIRWARGMIQILRLDNPLLGKGLKLSQRLCYANAMLHFLTGIPRLIFLVAPLGFLLFHAYIIYAPALAIVLFVLPHMVHASITNAQIQGKYRHSFWSEVYESVLAWYIAVPTTVALFNPHVGTFNVTAKGGVVDKRYLDWHISKPYLFLVSLNILGLMAGFYKLFYGDINEIGTVIISLLWVIYNMVILGAAVSVAVESKQVRHAHRVEMSMTGAIILDNGHLYSCHVHDYSDGGIGITLNTSNVVNVGDDINLLLKRDQQESVFPAKVMRVSGNSLGILLTGLNVDQHIDFIACTFARMDTWSKWQKDLPEDRPLNSLYEVIILGFRGYQRMAEYAPPVFHRILLIFTTVVGWLGSFFPRTV